MLEALFLEVSTEYDEEGLADHVTDFQQEAFHLLLAVVGGLLIMLGILRSV